MLFFSFYALLSSPRTARAALEAVPVAVRRARELPDEAHGERAAVEAVAVHHRVHRGLRGVLTGAAPSL